MTHIKDHQFAPDGVAVSNPAFDVTPNELIAAIITDRGVARAPILESLRALVEGKRGREQVERVRLDRRVWSFLLGKAAVFPPIDSQLQSGSQIDARLKAQNSRARVMSARLCFTSPLRGA